VNVIKIKPRHRAALLIVGMYCVMAYFRGIAIPLSFLTAGLIGIYSYKGGGKEMDQIVICQRGFRLKSLYFYGALVFVFVMYAFWLPPPYKKG